MKFIELLNGKESIMVCLSEISHMTKTDKAMFLYFKNGKGMNLTFKSDALEKYYKRISLLLKSL